MNKHQKEFCEENGMKSFNNYNKNDYTDFLENKLEQLSLCGVSGSADVDYWSERCKHAENIWEKSPCDPYITSEQREAYNEYHNFIKENGSKHYR